MKRALISAIAAVTIVGLGVPAAHAEANPSSGTTTPAAPSPDVEINGVSVTHGHASFSVGSKAIGKARAAAVAHQSASGPSRAEGKLKGRLVDAVEADGGTIDDEAIDVVPLLDGDITLRG